MKLTEKEIMYILHETKMLLTEDQESDSIKKAIALYMDRMGCDKKAAEKFVRIDLRNDFPNLRYKKPGKFILGVTRMFLNGDFRTGDAIQPLNTTLTYVASEAHYNEYDKNLNGLSANEIINRFADAVKADAEADKEKLSQQEYIANDDYDIVRVDNFEETSQYRQYCYPEDQWCITKYPNMLDSYTNNGIGQFYFCLRKGFENMKPIQGEGCPLDEYGISMFAVCVDGNGRLKTSTCRWNHSNGANDNILTTEQISKLIGRNFYDVFKPNNKLAEKLEGIKNRLKNGENIHDIFYKVKEIGDGILMVTHDDLGVNFIDSKTNEILSDKWFVYCDGTIKNGYIITRMDNHQYFYFCLEDRKIYDNRQAAKKVGEKIEQLLQSGKTLDEIKEVISIERVYKSPFYDPIEIRCMGYNNMIENNHLKFNNWYYELSTITQNSKMTPYYRVCNGMNEKTYIMNENEEKAIEGEWDWVSTNLSIYNTLVISDDNGSNIISIDNPSHYLCKRSFEKFIRIGLKLEDGSFIFIGEDNSGCIVCDEDGRDLVGMYFEKIKEGYSNKMFYAYKNDKMVIIYTDDFTLSDWYDKIDTKFISDYSPTTKVYKDNKENLLNCITKKIFPNWFDKIIDLYATVYVVEENGLFNIIEGENGQLLSEEWFAEIKRVENKSCCFIVTNRNGKQNIFSYRYSNPLSWEYELQNWYDKVEVLGLGDIMIEEDGQTQTFNNYSYLRYNI